MRRRDLLMTGTAGTLLGALGSVAAAADPAPAGGGGAGQGSASDRALDRVADAVADLRSELRDERSFPELTAIRGAQKQFLRGNGKFPDFVDVGVDVWFQVHDWHIRWQVPLQQSRDGQGRMTIALDQTLIVLRPDVQPGYVGLPYDAR